MDLYELNKKLKIARLRCFIFNQINKLPIKNCSSLPNINTHYYFKLQIPIMHPQFFNIISQNAEYAEHFESNGNNPFHFACQKWMSNQ